ncbi:hypothetical protein HDU80_009380 [Chytriomyces hyalinus]|nr:hypothetical protein HDU80_009380 [Chytriomyces hyalinus]
MKLLSAVAFVAVVAVAVPNPQPAFGLKQAVAMLGFHKQLINDAPKPSPSPEYKAPQYKAPEYKAPEYKAPEYKQPQYKQPEYKQEQYAPSKGYTTDTPFRCGSSWENANSKCGDACPSGKDFECGYGEKCFRDLQKTCDSYQPQQPSYYQPQYEQPKYEQPKYEPKYEQPQYKAPEYKQPQYKNNEAISYSLESVLSPGYYVYWSKDGSATLSKSVDIYTTQVSKHHKNEIFITVKSDGYNKQDVCLEGEKKNYGEAVFANCPAGGNSYNSGDGITTWSVEEVQSGYGGYDSKYDDSECIYVVFKHKDSYGKSWCLDAGANDSYGVKEGHKMITFECKPNHKPQQWKACEAESSYSSSNNYKSY